MRHRTHTAKRIVIVGGGLAGLSIASRLAQAGLPTTVLESSHVGFGASTRNQGWLYSGAWYAPEQPQLARMCYEALQQVVQFCPDAMEPGCGPMVHLISESETDPNRWTSAWDVAGIPYAPVATSELFERFRGLAISQARQAFQLPDRAVRTDILLRCLAAAAEKAGAEIRTDTPVAQLIREEDSIEGVVTRGGETIPARLVILAGNVSGGFLIPGFGAQAVGSQQDAALVIVKTHLIAARPAISQWPLCVLDAEGFNHIPHQPTSVFGTQRFLPIAHDDGGQTIDSEIERLWSYIHRFFPDFRREDHAVIGWAGNTVQATPLDQADSGQAPMPMVVDHQHESASISNLLSVFTGRATLWPHLAELAQQAVFEKLGTAETRVAAPFWGAPFMPRKASLLAELEPRPTVLYRCQTCGHEISREAELDAPACCDAIMTAVSAEAPSQ